MKKILLAVFLVLLLNLSLVYAVTQQELSEAKNLIDAKTDCKNLSDSQLEIIGEYYMEQMHPGEAHKLMHKMMGLEEGSEDEEQFHISMAKSIYCGENTAGMMGGGMMNVMGGNMMGGNIGGNMMGYGMMNSGYIWYWNFLNVLYAILLIGSIILVYLWIMKLWKNNAKHKGGKR
ncbi:MAG: hypothetical protein Q7J54_04225 [Candidatus Woesearchaeota archaeon]|nr:hypothetical protein [Candidatus Woesearchaeota archaeon]